MIKTLFLLFFGVATVQAESLQLIKKIPLPPMEGRLDHMAVDVRGKRLFLAALGNNSLEVIDLAQEKSIETVKGLKEPQGVAYDSVRDRLFVANGGNGEVTVVNGAKYRKEAKIDFWEDADNLFFEERTNSVIVGYSGGWLGAVDAEGLKKLWNTGLRGHPDGFVAETVGHRIFVNLPGGTVAVIDRLKEKVDQVWAPGRGGNFSPMALDEVGQRLFLGSRNPNVLLAVNTETGDAVGFIDINPDVDGVWYDAARKRIYVSCGEGMIIVINQASPDQYEVVQKIPTSKGARTSLYSNELDRFYLAVPQRGGQMAEVWVYAPQN